MENTTKYGVPLVIGITAVLLAGGAYLTSGGGGLPAPVAADDNIKGNLNAPIVLVEYSDFECPACAVYSAFVNRLYKDLGDDIAVVFRHFPLSQHRNAELAAYAAEAAGTQGKFWEMHDVLFERRDDWAGKPNANETFLSYAEELELDIDKFNNDIEGDAIKSGVAADSNGALKARIMSTPTFFLNGEKIKAPGDYEEFRALVEAELSAI